MGSVQDRATRNAARATGLTIPTRAGAYVRWWSRNNHARNEFCARELRFAERNPAARREAEGSGGVSLRGRRDRDPVRRARCLRRFASWYLGVDEALSSTCVAAEDSGKSVSKSARLDAVDVAASQRVPAAELPSPSNLKIPSFNQRLVPKHLPPAESNVQRRDPTNTPGGDDVSHDHFSLFGRPRLLQTIPSVQCPRRRLPYLMCQD